jgi:hypothetical protein
MPSSFIPQRIKRAEQQITVKHYQDQLAMLHSYGRFIDDSRDYIISQALELVFKRDKEFARWVEQPERMVSRSESAGIAPQAGPQREVRGEASSRRNCGPGAKRISLAERRIES